ncbi:hypothetical protein JKA74_00065 [Marivirga sp. S37H4]|uniref:Uncharacterized protein n=1 Tax=Marivirga aurantiaca TaxID=2802615 RepID=A0A935C4P9_9BACT|nr:hypothetical protein [Marivirga aurantiaca]MBK6263409.1 hypothetical protein [Marivirga aurantiaca]
MRNIEIAYLLLATAIWFAGYFHNGRFVRPKWKIPGKFVFYVGVSFALTYWFGHWALIFILGHPIIGLIFHTKVCRENNINWLSCEPREKYLELQEKWAKGDFTKSTKKE